MSSMYQCMCASSLHAHLVHVRTHVQQCYAHASCINIYMSLFIIIAACDACMNSISIIIIYYIRNIINCGSHDVYPVISDENLYMTSSAIHGCAVCGKTAVKHALLRGVLHVSGTYTQQILLVVARSLGR